MVFEVYVVLDDPVRVIQRERHLDEPLAEHVAAVQASLERGEDLLEANLFAG